MKIATVLTAGLLAASCSDPPKPAHAQTPTVADHLVATSQEMMKPVETVAVDAMQAHVDAILQKEAKRKEKRAAAREAAKSKMYRWKDSRGTWHLTDTPPAQGEATELTVTVIEQ